jgi:uncharacterized protein YukE
MPFERPTMPTWDLPLVRLEDNEKGRSIILIGTAKNSAVSAKRLHAQLRALHAETVVVDGHLSALGLNTSAIPEGRPWAVSYPSEFDTPAATTTSTGGFDAVERVKALLSEHERSRERLKETWEGQALSNFIDQLAPVEADMMVVTAYAAETNAKLVLAARHPRIEHQRAAGLENAPRRVATLANRVLCSIVPFCTTGVVLPMFNAPFWLQARMVKHALLKDFAGLQKDGEEYLRILQNELPVFSSSSAGQLYMTRAHKRLLTLAELNDNHPHATAAKGPSVDHEIRDSEEGVLAAPLRGFRPTLTSEPPSDSLHEASARFLEECGNSLSDEASIATQALMEPGSLQEPALATLASSLTDVLPPFGTSSFSPRSRRLQDPRTDDECCALLASALKEAAATAQGPVVAVVNAGLIPGVVTYWSSYQALPSPQQRMEVEGLNQYPVLLTTDNAVMASSAAFAGSWLHRLHLRGARRPVPLATRFFSVHFPLAVASAAAVVGAATHALGSFYLNNIKPRIVPSH